jgi:hypothetical protein
MPKTNHSASKPGGSTKPPASPAWKLKPRNCAPETSILRTELGTALGEAERLASAACRHPAGAVDGGTFRACGTEAW